MSPRNPMTRHVLGCCLFLAATLASLTAEATVALRLSNQELAQEAELIVIGRCLEVRTAWEGRTLVTLATISVTEVLKGAADSTITVALPGGIDANRRFPVAMTYAAAPQVKPDEEVFLFLASDEAIVSGYTVLGFSQGKFSIVAEPSGRKVVSRDLTNLVLQGGPGAVQGTLTLTSLSEFKDQVLEYLR
jgi:hypothetical protein